VGTGKVELSHYRPKKFSHPPECGPCTFQREIHIWTNGSALDNGLETCQASVGWISDLEFSDSVSLSGIPLSNNVAEIAAVILGLSAWEAYNLVVHTDLTLVLKLVHRGLLAME